MARLTLNETMDRLLLLVRAGYPVIYIISHEESRVLNFVARIVRVIRSESPAKNLYTWQIGVGLQRVDNLAGPEASPGDIDWLAMQGMPDVVLSHERKSLAADEALNAVMDASSTSHPFLPNSLVTFFDLHPFLLTGPNGIMGPLVRPLRNAADKLRRHYDANWATEGRPYQTLVIVAPSAANLSPELDRDIIKIDFPLPERDELLMTLRTMTESDPPMLRFPSDMPDGQREHLSDLIAGAGRGLTLEDYRRGLNMFAVRDSKSELSSAHIEDMLNLKAKAIGNDEALHYTPHVEIELGGLHAIKEWIQIRKEPAVSESLRKEYRLPSSKGVMLCGVSGGGKSQLAKLIAKEFNLALLRLDVGALFGSYVGESEERTRRALVLAEVLAPVVLWLDEIDKAFSGISGGGDNGVSARVFGHFLTWLAEKQDSVFVVTTANDFQPLLNQFPEFGRKGRFDEIFWVDLPSREARKEIFRIYLRPHFELGNEPGRRFLDIAREELSRLATQEHRPSIPQDGDLLDAFCELLSHVSGQMTGAEIEYAITEALYSAYRLDVSEPLGRKDKFTPSLIVETVKRAQTRCLGGGTGEARIKTQREIARANNWIFAESASKDERQA